MIFVILKQKVHGVQECNFFGAKGVFPFLQESSSGRYSVMSLESREFFGGEQYKCSVAEYGLVLLLLETFFFSLLVVGCFAWFSCLFVLKWLYM